MAYRRWREVADLERPDLWVRRTCANLAVSQFRRRMVELRATATPGRTPAAAAELSPAGEEFWAAVRALPQRQAQAAALRFVYDMPLAEIATTLGTSEGTVKQHLSRARARPGRPPRRHHAGGGAMTDLDTLARAATQELLERSAPDVLEPLRRPAAHPDPAYDGQARRRGRGGRRSAVGGWQLARPRAGGRRAGAAARRRPQRRPARRSRLGDAAAGAWGHRRTATHLRTCPRRRPASRSTSSPPTGPRSSTPTAAAASPPSTWRRDERGRWRDCPDDVCAASVSPDGGTIAYRRRRRLPVAASAAARTAVPRRDVGAAGAPAWSPDGRPLAFVGADGLHVVDRTARLGAQLASSDDDRGRRSRQPGRRTAARSPTSTTRSARRLQRGDRVHRAWPSTADGRPPAG